MPPLPRPPTVELAGGANQLMAAARSAFDAGDHRWAAEVLKHAVYAEPTNGEARELLARTFEQMGFAAESSIWRNFYLTGALELREGPPAKGFEPAAALDLLQHTPIERILEAMATRLNAPKAGSIQLKINLVFSDLKASYVLQIENAVSHIHESAPTQDANASSH